MHCRAETLVAMATRMLQPLKVTLDPEEVDGIGATCRRVLKSQIKGFFHAYRKPRVSLLYPEVGGGKLFNSARLSPKEL